jgi:hypothetical protein
MGHFRLAANLATNLGNEFSIPTPIDAPSRGSHDRVTTFYGQYGGGVGKRVERPLVCHKQRGDGAWSGCLWSG